MQLTDKNHDDYLGYLRTKEFCGQCRDLEHCPICDIPWVLNHILNLLNKLEEN